MAFLNYLLSINPGQAFSYYTELIILAALLIIGSIIFSQIYKKKKKTNFAFKRLFKKTSNRFFLLGFLYVILILLRYENIPYFSMRIWLYLSTLLLIFVLYKTIKTYIIDYPKEKENSQAKKVVRKETKYLPDKKKK